MKQITNSKRYDLEERTFEFARDVNQYVKNLPKNIPNFETGKQLVRAGGSIGANCREANEALGKKDFLMRIKICKKESKETLYWLRLSEPAKDWIEEKERLMQEANELMKIFGSILEKSK
jgi:four helix bundle protein